VRLGGVLAPPYDVISAEQRDALYGRNLRNIVRIDYGLEYAGDVPGENDRYTRAASFLQSWLDLGILLRDAEPAVYVTDHEFQHPDGDVRHRRGVFATVAAKPWEASDLRPHERTMSAPKLDRLALLRATRVQTSAVFAMWTPAPSLTNLLDDVTQHAALAGGRTDGELGSEKHLLWQANAAQSAAITEALRAATLYVADGHHRYETVVTYAQETNSRDMQCLVYLAAADDPALTILPTHRLVRPGPGVAFSLDDLWARLDDAWEEESTRDVHDALAHAAALRTSHHAFAVVAHDGVAVLRRPRGPAASPRDALDSTVLETEVLGPAGISAAATGAGALGYTRDAGELEAAVRRGEAVLGFGLQPASAAEVIATADAGQTMPQKSTYFYPKVPTGVVLYPV
jgi:uncharacterized protein (DUF1015 family)